MDVPYAFVRALASGFWFCVITSGVPGIWGILLAVLGVAGLIFTWTYKMNPPRRIR